MSFSQASFLETSLSQKTAPAHEEKIRLLGETVRGVKEEREKDEEALVVNGRAGFLAVWGGSAVLWVVNLLARVKFHPLPF